MSAALRGYDSPSKTVATLPASAGLQNGGFVVTWAWLFHPEDNDNHGIFAVVGM